MWRFQKTDPLRYLSDSRFVTFVGSGGKTTFMELCAKKLLMSGKNVAVTTTTKIYAKKPYRLIDDEFGLSKHSSFIRIGKSLANGKLTGLEFDEVERLGRIFDVVLIEADGAKGKPLKFPASHEPVIPPFSDKIFVVCGLDALYGKIEDTVFRWELFREKTEVQGSDTVTPQLLMRLLSADAMLRNVDIRRCSVILNKYDRLNNRHTILDIVKEAIETKGIPDVTISSALFDVFYKTVKIH